MQQKISLPNPFSKREQEVFLLLMRGNSNRKIAASLGICQKTVEKHLTSIYIRIGVFSRAEAILWGVQRDRDFPT